MKMKTSVASQVAAKKAEGMIVPLLESDRHYESDRDLDDADSSSSSEVETVKQSSMEVLRSFIVYLVLAAGVAASAAAMVASPTLVTYIMGGLLIAIVPHSVIKERQLGQLPLPNTALRSMNNKLSEEANLLSMQVDFLSQEIDSLKPEADRAAAVEEELRAIAEKKSFNISRLVDLVKENESILAQMKINLRQRICQDMIQIILRSDKNNDQIISKGEANLLALRIRLQLHEYGVEFDCEKFLRFIGNTSSVTALIEISRRLLQTEGDMRADEGEKADLEDLYDMFHVEKSDVKAAAAGGKWGPNTKSGNHSIPVGRISLMS